MYNIVYLSMGSKRKLKLNRIRVVLAEKEISQVDLSEGINKGRVTVNRYCSNDIQPPLDVLYEIASYLEVDVCDLLVSKKTETS